MNTAIGVIIVLVLLGGGWYFYNQNSISGGEEAMVEENHDGDAMVEEGDTDAMMEGEDDGVMMEEAGNPVAFNLTGRSFEFSQSEIRVKKGDVVTINFESTEGFHDWVVDEFFAATDRVNTGGAASVTFTADETGSFEYYCSVGNHRAQGMIGTLIVE